MLHYRIHGFLLMELTVRKAFQSYVSHFCIERAAMKTQHFANIWKTTLALLFASNYAPGFIKNLKLLKQFSTRLSSKHVDSRTLNFFVSMICTPIVFFRNWKFVPRTISFLIYLRRVDFISFSWEGFSKHQIKIFDSSIRNYIIKIKLMVVRAHVFH